MNIEIYETENQFSGRYGYSPDMIVCHIAEGYYEGTISWMKNPASQVSSNYIVGKQGQIAQMVNIRDGAWCNGTSTSASSKNYYKNAVSSIVKSRPYNANYYTVSIEFEGFNADTGGALTEKQYAATVDLFEYIITEIKRIYAFDFAIDSEHIIGHNKVNPITKPICPGEQFPFTKLIEDVNERMGSEPPEPPKDIEVGDFVSINQSATVYATGETIPQWVKDGEHTVSQIRTGEALLKEIYSWVFTKDLTVEDSTVPEGIEVGDMVDINQSATVYATGETIPGWVKNGEYTVSQIKSDRVLLKEIYSWVFLKDVTKVESSQGTFSVGDKVMFSGAAETYATGETIPGWVKERMFTLSQVKTDRGLLKEIYSWAFLSDLEK